MSGRVDSSSVKTVRKNGRIEWRDREGKLHREDHFEAGLVDRVLDHVELQPGGLPLLEFALTQLWERRDACRITHAAYEAIGEVAGAISQRAETVFLTLDADQRRRALSLFTRLLRVAVRNEVEPDTRRRVELDALNQAERSVLQPFVDARLLVLDRGESAAKHTIEMAHEALIHSWGRVEEWVSQQREFLLWRQRLGQSLGEWHRTERDKTALLRGPALKEAVAWASERKADLSEAEDDFIRRSHKTERRRRRWLGVAIALAAVIIGVVPAYVFASQMNAVTVWRTVRVASAKMDDAAPSTVAAWVHVMDVAGRLDEIGSAIFEFPERPLRFRALYHAAVIMAYQGRTLEANRLADRALKISRGIPDLDSSAGAQMTMADLLTWVGREEAARPFALRAFALARQEQEPMTLAEVLADAALTFARVGLQQGLNASNRFLYEYRSFRNSLHALPPNRIQINSCLCQTGKWTSFPRFSER